MPLPALGNHHTSEPHFAVRLNPGLGRPRGKAHGNSRPHTRVSVSAILFSRFSTSTETLGPPKTYLLSCSLRCFFENQPAWGNDGESGASSLPPPPTWRVATLRGGDGTTARFFFQQAVKEKLLHHTAPDCDTSKSIVCLMGGENVTFWREAAHPPN